MWKKQAAHLTKQNEKNHVCDSAILPITSIIAGRPSLLWVYGVRTHAAQLVVNYLVPILEYLPRGGSLPVQNNITAFLNWVFDKTILNSCLFWAGRLKPVTSPPTSFFLAPIIFRFPHLPDAGEGGETPISPRSRTVSVCHHSACSCGFKIPSKPQASQQ